jgi:LacI family transcriptional regulator
MNIDDIAKRSGVSRSTVSRVLNEQPGVKQATREHVLNIIAEQGHQPKPPTGAFALVVPHIQPRIFADTFFAYVLNGIQQVAQARDFDILIWLSEQYEKRNYRSLVQRQLVDGALILNSHELRPLVKRLANEGFPCVILGRPEVENVSYVDVDNRQAAKHAVEHLMRLGRRRVATISGNMKTAVAVDRLLGYEDAIRSAGQHVDPNLIVSGYFTDEGGYKAMAVLVDAAPDAVFIASDNMAVGALRCLREAGISVPGDIALVSYDNLPVSTSVVPALTTVHQPLETIGQVATSLLLDVIERRDLSPRRIVLPTQLIVRESCGGLISKGVMSRTRVERSIRPSTS